MPVLEQVRRLHRELEAVRRGVETPTYGEYLWALARSLPQVIKRRRLTPADRRITGPIRVRMGDRVFDLTGSSFGGVREMFLRRVYFPRPAFVPRPGDLVVDLGANIGMVSLLCAGLGADVLAIEAQAGFREEMLRLLRLNNCENKVRLVWALVAAEGGLFSDREKLRSSSAFQGEPPSLSMAELLEPYGNREVALLKCDIEGSEFALFLKNNDWLNRVRRIAMEVHLEFGNLDQLRGVLESKGFTTWITDAASRPVTIMPGRVGYCYAERA